MVFLRGAFPDAVVGETVFPVSAGEISASGPAVREMVRQEWLCAGGIPTQSGGTRGAHPANLRFSLSSMGGEKALNALHADVAGLGCRSRGSGNGWSRQERLRLAT